MLTNIIALSKSADTIDQQLAIILENGFIEVNQCVLLKYQYDLQSHISRADFVDDTGYECFINSIHIDDYVEANCLSQAIMYAQRLIEMWASLYRELPLEVIISSTDIGVNIRFHKLRKGENWINLNDLEKFQESLIVIRNQ